ncbi:Myo-inositol transporter 1 [Fusarium venenatum]|uniref:general substrate transporter n=1 Tax=Fusarium venenatum TaxID=56646 RepID=UPI001DEA773D|nr:Myo-inositol transporter 1 [Fusarium venenatum]KAH7006699.1 general substrate transporter [Fusarium venenatum]
MAKNTEVLEPSHTHVSHVESHVKGEQNLIEDSAPGLFLNLCVVATAIGGMLFGYDTGVISGVLVVLGDDLDGRFMSPSEKELITALCAAGAFVGAIIAGVTADKYGRKPAIWFASVLFTIGAVVQASSYSLIQMCVGRVLVGLGVGSASMVIPLYIAEIAPAKYRGRMISIDMVFLATGSLLAYAFDAAFYKVNHGWRYMVGLGALPSILLGVLLFWCPESPRQLCFHNRPEECLHVLQRMYPTANETQVAQMMADIQYGVAQAKALNEEISVRQSLKSLITVPANRRAAIVACGLMATQQLCGFNTMMYYSSTLFQIVGFNNPIAVGTIVTATNWIFTFASVFLIDRVGRRRLLLWTMWGMSVFLLLAAGVFTKIPIDQQTLQLTNDSVGWPAIVVLVSMILFVASYAAGLGCVPWQANEFLPMEVRAIGTMMINICNWGPNIIVSSTFLSMMRGISPSGTFGFYAALSFIGFVFVFFCYPEAAGMTLEEIRVVFDHGFGVRYAEEWRTQRKLGNITHGANEATQKVV